MSRIIDAGYEILQYPRHAQYDIETAARTCYKSEDKMTDKSAEKMVISLIERGHHAMIEFGGWITVKFYSNRGFTHEMVRHRLSSFAQESTRYCNYSKGKFDGRITCVNPSNMIKMKIAGHDKQMKILAAMISAWDQAEENYMELLKIGAPPEVAREVLPIGLKAEIVVGANVREWRHIFSQRCSKKAHPRMREVMIPLLDELKHKVPVVFDDLWRKYVPEI